MSTPNQEPQSITHAWRNVASAGLLIHSVCMDCGAGKVERCQPGHTAFAPLPVELIATLNPNEANQPPYTGWLRPQPVGQPAACLKAWQAKQVEPAYRLQPIDEAYVAWFKAQPISKVLQPIVIVRQPHPRVAHGGMVRTSPDCDACGRPACWLLASFPCCDKCMPGLLRNRLRDISKAGS